MREGTIAEVSTVALFPGHGMALEAPQMQLKVKLVQGDVVRPIGEVSGRYVVLMDLAWIARWDQPSAQEV